MAAISFVLNGEPVTVEADGDRILLWVLRTNLGLTGTKYGCGQAHCGACTVVVDGTAVPSCAYPLKNLEGREVLTIEGLAEGRDLHPLQEAFARHGGQQCGYCTPGMIMRAYGLLQQNPRPSREEIIEGMENNLCRCGAHTRILEAIEAAAAQMEGGGR